MGQLGSSRTFASALLISVFVITVTVDAHHSVNAEFDASKNISAVGMLTKVELINPHGYVHFDIKGSDGTVKSWSFLTGAPAALKAAGISVRDTLKVGETYQIVYSPARKAANVGLLWSLVLPDGRFVAFGSANNVEAARELSKPPARAQ